MTRYKPGDVVLIHFPFTDLSSRKKRPALVLNPVRYGVRGDVVVMAMTSQPQKQSSLHLRDWKKAGLPKPTWVKPVIGTLATSLVLRRLGRIAPSDYPCVKQALVHLLDARFIP